jgi:hypothetical protein
MILGKYSLGRLHLNCHQIGRLEISQNFEMGLFIFEFSFVGLRCFVPGLIERSKIGVVGKLLWDAS